jgi:hypothetical protein
VRRLTKRTEVDLMSTNFTPPPFALCRSSIVHPAALLRKWASKESTSRVSLIGRLTNTLATTCWCRAVIRGSKVVAPDRKQAAQTPRTSNRIQRSHAVREHKVAGWIGSHILAEPVCRRRLLYEDLRESVRRQAVLINWPAQKVPFASLNPHIETRKPTPAFPG